MTTGRRDLTLQRWKHARKRILERDGHECQIRGRGCRQVADTVDHIVPHALGGGDDPGNLRAACRPCNSSLAKNARNGGGGASFDRRSSPFAPPSPVSLAEPLSGRVTRRTHRQVPG